MSVAWERGQGWHIRSSPSIAEAYPGGPRRGHHIVLRIHTLELLERFLDGDGHDVRRLQRDHVAPAFVFDRAHGGATKPRRQQTVVPRGLPAPLEMAEHERARLLAGDLLDV